MSNIELDMLKVRITELEEAMTATVQMVDTLGNMLDAQMDGAGAAFSAILARLKMLEDKQRTFGGSQPWTDL